MQRGVLNFLHNDREKEWVKFYGPAIPSAKSLQTGAGQVCNSTELIAHKKSLETAAIPDRFGQ